MSGVLIVVFFAIIMIATLVFVMAPFVSAAISKAYFEEKLWYHRMLLKEMQTAAEEEKELERGKSGQ